MKKIAKKRLVYTSLATKKTIIGAYEYDGDLSDSNILGSVHELGKTEWLPTTWISGDNWEKELWLMCPDMNNPTVKHPIFRINVQTFYYYQKTWWDYFCDSIKRILRI